MTPFELDLIPRGSYEHLEIGLSDDPDSMTLGDK
jgi:hypothetical protein